MYQLGELLSFDEVAAVRSISRRTVQRLVKAKALVPTYVSPRRPRFPVEQVAAYRLREFSDLKGGSMDFTAYLKALNLE
jgi:hypothetical protein